MDPGRQLITVVRKGTRELQELPASTDAFVWLRLYQVQMADLIPKGRRQPLWWTLRRPARPLTYHAVHRMFERVNQQAGTSVTLHALRHTAAYRMAEDPALPLTDVQFVLGHAQLTTTQIYLTPRKEDVIRRVLAHHAEQTRRAVERVRPAPAPGYRPETLDALFGTWRVVTTRLITRAYCRGHRQQGGKRAVFASRPGILPSPGRPPVKAVTRCGTVDPRAFCGGQRPHAEDPPPGADVSAGLVGSPAGPDLAGTVAGQRGRRRRRGMAQDPGPMAAGARPGRRLAAGCAGLGVAGGDQRRSRSPRAGLAGGQATGPGSLVRHLAHARDPDGFARLKALCDADPHVSSVANSHTLHRAAEILATKGGRLADVTVGDVLELLDAELDTLASVPGDAAVFYRLLRTTGVFGPDAPTTLREIRGSAGPRTPEELIDRYRLFCRPVRDLLVDYLRERQPSLDYSSMESLACALGARFWRDLEIHHPGIDSLRLPPRSPPPGNNGCAPNRRRLRPRPGRRSPSTSHGSTIGSA